MAKDSYEKDYDDEVYEDGYYEEHYEEEELDDDSDSEEEVLEKDQELEDEEWDNEKKVTLSFACEDCDYRWEDVVIKRNDVLVDIDEEVDVACPMCGSMNTSQI